MRAVFFILMAWSIAGHVMAQAIPVEPLPGLPHAVSNNAVALVESTGGVYLFSFLGLGSGKTWQDISASAFVLNPGAEEWRELGWAEPAPGEAGRLAASAVSAGVRIQYAKDDSPRQFLPSDECWTGSIDVDNHRRINWRQVSPHPGLARYRMAAVGDSEQRVVFAGGSVNPYNFNGIGYNGVPSEAEKSVFSFSFKTREWRQHGDLPRATMDHRGLPNSKGWYYLAGGMRDQQQVVTDVYRFRIDP